MSRAEQREEAVFEAALQLPADQRGAYLDTECAGDAELRRRVQALLGAFERAGGFMKQSAADSSGRTRLVSLPPTEKPGDCIGRYKLLEQIGEGGCGVVYVAEQKEPVRRRVALKVIKLGMDTKQVIARFDAERQALALMDHPNIAKVFDGGAAETGRPYFVMELVRGIKITDYCNEHELSPHERLELFIQVCRAIQHAHQKGIIHRDIKPSNILVASDDGLPVPKVIDFGIAKATQGRLTDQTVYTAFEQFMGTPAYMSPEQAEMSLHETDTRTDIYSLGVLLYELLTGKTPFDAKELVASGLEAMRRTIREKEPARPSTRLSTMLEGELTTTARQRHTEAPRLVRLLRGDLDWIVMKALEKDRARRYETANGLATDVQRHLNCEPVAARPPSKLYEFQKTVRRHKVGFAATVAIISVLAVGVLVSTWQAIRAKQAEAAAYAYANQARINAEQAERNAQQAQNEAKAKTAALVAEQKARDQAFAMLRSMTADLVEARYRPGTVLTEDDRAFLQGIIVQSMVVAKARYYISLSQWDKAAVEYAQADWSRPVQDDTFSYACLFLIRGDGEGYTRFCNGMVQRAGQMENPESYVLARICAMGRNSPVDPARILQWANHVGVVKPWELHLLGLAQYRAGQFDLALQSFTRSNIGGWTSDGIDCRGLNWLALALVHYRLGQPDEARQCFDKANQWLSQVGPSGPDQPVKLLPQDWVEAQLLHREAEAFLTK